jgi:hypothetical protein
MILKKLTAVFISVIMVVAALTGCTAPEPSPISLVPQSANLVAEIKIGNILNDQALVAGYDDASINTDNPQTVQEELDKIKDKTGLNLHDFSQVLLFCDTTNIKDPGDTYGGIIAQGTFNEKQFVQNIEDKSGKPLSVSEYKGYQLYVNSDDNYSLVFFSSSTLVIGSEQAVKDSIDVRKADAKPLSGVIIDTYNNLGEASFKAVFAFPDTVRQALNDEVPGSSAISAQAFANLDMLGLSSNKGAQDVTCNINLHFTDTASMQNAKDMLSGMITMYKGMTPTPELKTLLGEIQFTPSGTWLNISLKTTLAEIQAISKSATNK